LGFINCLWVFLAVSSSGNETRFNRKAPPGMYFNLLKQGKTWEKEQMQTLFQKKIGKIFCLKNLFIVLVPIINNIYIFCPWIIKAQPKPKRNK